MTHLTQATKMGGAFRPTRIFIIAITMAPTQMASTTVRRSSLFNRSGILGIGNLYYKC